MTNSDCETIVNMAMYIGSPAVLEYLLVAKEVCADQDL